MTNPTTTKVHLLVEAEIHNDLPEATLKALARSTLWQAIMAGASNVDERGMVYETATATITFSSPKVVIENPGRKTEPETNIAKSIVSLCRRCANKIVDLTYQAVNKLA